MSNRELKPLVSRQRVKMVVCGREPGLFFTTSDELGGATSFEVEHEGNAAVPSDDSIPCCSTSASPHSGGDLVDCSLCLRKRRRHC